MAEQRQNLKFDGSGIINRRQFIKNCWELGLTALGLTKVVAFLAGCAPAPASPSSPQEGELHPTPVITRSEIPSTAVILFNQSEQRITRGALELYQNTSPDWQNMPFIIYVDVEAFENLSNQLASEGVTDSNITRLVVHWPGNPAGSELVCQSNRSRISLEFARAIYEHVYKPYFYGKDLNNPQIRDRFLASVESQMNYVLYHEAEHIGHCRDGVDNDEAEILAKEAEGQRTQQIGKVLYIQLREGYDLNGAMQYVEGFRN